MPLESWVSYPAEHPFPLENLPYGVAQPSPAAAPRPVTAIGEYVVDLSVLGEAKLFSDAVNAAFQSTTLNNFMGLGRAHWVATRQTLQGLLGKDEASLRDNKELREAALLPLAQVSMVLPVNIGDYTDFYSSKEHATNLGKLFRPGQAPLLPNWTWIPVGYHGRASSIVVSGTPVKRPWGQIRPNEEEPPIFSPCKALDFELEMAFYVGPGNALGTRIPIDKAEDHIFGFSVFNDWSARDIQKWEYVPLGPFQGKNFSSTVSPWIVSLEALEPFRVPAPLSYLQESNPKGQWDIQLEVLLQTQKMENPQTISKSNHKYLYWSPRQQLAHHAVSGCNLRTGDCLASGTISGPEENSCGSMIELSWRGSKPIDMSSGEKRGMIQDGDTLIIRGWCQGEGYRIGFGEARGQVLPADE